MELKKVSVVIPVYNVEKYLQECIDSLLHQTYTNIEIILVDDESTDKSPAICDLAASKDFRVKVFHKKNGGAASARNFGLDYVTGYYTCFVDSDDVVSNQYISRLVQTAEENMADVAVCGFSSYYKNRKERMGYKGEILTMTQTQYLARFLDDWTCGLIWNKVFKTEVMKGVRFKEGHKIDDEFFTYRIIMNCKRIVLFEESLYLYRMRASSVMSSASNYEQQILRDKIEYMVERFECITEKYPELEKIFLANLSDNLIQFWRTSRKYPEIQKHVKLIIDKYKRKILLSDLNIKIKYAFIRAIYFEKEKKENFEMIRPEENGLFE